MNLEMKKMKLEEMMFTPIYDDKMLNVMEDFNMEIPQLDEEYEREEVVYTDSKDDSIGFEFREINGYSTNGEPCLTHISIRKSYQGDLPYNISFNNSFDECCQKIGRTNDYNSTRSMFNENKYWIIGENNGIEILMTIRFTKKFESIKSVLLNNFDVEDVGIEILENKK
jgi:hypothetical protein